MLDEALKAARLALDEARESGTGQLAAEETGVVIRASGGIARVSGLPRVTSEEVMVFEDGSTGLAVNLDRNDVGVILLDQKEDLRTGLLARRTGRVADTPVGEALLGRVVDALGRPLDEAGPVRCRERRPVETPAPAITVRAPVEQPLQTGITVVDALIPVGRGQRELILGDRQTGKTAVAVDAIINQRDTGVVCIYCAVGQRGTAVARVIETLRREGALAHTVVMVAAGEDTPGLQFLTPYAATTVGEYFMAQGRDVLVVYDDLTRHARAYRELSLLLRRPPGREAFPGDIFYIHSRLLERATHVREPLGGGSLTALPIAETEAQDMSAYIPTNLISITDGQIYLSPELFRKGLLPAVDVGQSVSRVGGKTQLPAYRQVAVELRLAYAQFEELESFARFATRLDESSRQRIERGRRVRAVLRQAQASPLRACEQIAVLRALNTGALDAIDVERIAEATQRIRVHLLEASPELAVRIDDGATVEATDWESLDRCLGEALSGLSGEPVESERSGSDGDD